MKYLFSLAFGVFLSVGVNAQSIKFTNGDTHDFGSVSGI